MNSIKLLVVLCCFVAVCMAEELSLKGGAKELEGDKFKEAEDQLIDSLSKVAPIYKLVKLISGTYQTVGGSKYELKAELIDAEDETHTCDISIYNQPWIKEQGAEVTINCPGHDEIKRKHDN